MARLRLRTQLLIANLLIICALVGALLLFVRHTVRSEIAQQVRQGTNASLAAFESVQQERDVQLSSHGRDAFRIAHFKSPNDHARRAYDSRRV